MKTLIIKAKDFTDLVPVDKNVDVENSGVNNVIDATQESKVRWLLGDEFYNDFLTKIAASRTTGGTPLSPEYQTLLDDYIKPMLAWWTYYNYLDFAFIRVKPQGPVTLTSDTAEVIDRASLNGQKQTSSAHAQTYEDNAYDYLQKNKDSYPLLTHSRNQDKSPFFGSL